MRTLSVLGLLALILTSAGCGNATPSPNPATGPTSTTTPSTHTTSTSTATTSTTTAPGSVDVGIYEVYEITLNHDQSAYSNVWEEAWVSAQFTAPDGTVLEVAGFYYDADTWKIRFAPDSTGIYTVHYELLDALGPQLALDDTFTVGDSQERGFVRQHATNPFRFVYERDGGLFSAQGFGSCVRDPISTSFPTAWENKGWCIDKYTSDDLSACGKSADEYLDVYVGQTDLELFRWSVNNCAFPLWQQLDTDHSTGVGTPNNHYDVTWGQWGDHFARQLRDRGARIYFDPVGFGWQSAQWGTNCGPNYDEDCTANVCGAQGDRPCTAHNAAIIDTNDLAALKRYYSYIIARYGAYVDYYQLINEFPLPDAALTELSNHIRATDPYGHLVTTSWARPDHPGIEVHSPHLYQYSNTWDMDLTIVDSLVNGQVGGAPFPAKSAHQKPIIVDETGDPFQDNTGEADFEIRTRIGTRIKLWTAFFNEASIIPWESSLSSAEWLGGVVFLSPELRTALAAHNAFVADIDPAVQMSPMQTLSNNGDTVRVYGLASPNEHYLYLIHPVLDPASPTQATGFTVDIDAPIAGTVEWVSTENGSIVASESVVAGPVTLDIPGFEIDLSLRLR